MRAQPHPKRGGLSFCLSREEQGKPTQLKRKRTKKLNMIEQKKIAFNASYFLYAFCLFLLNLQWYVLLSKLLRLWLGFQGSGGGFASGM
jgi:hypothetical protein